MDLDIYQATELLTCGHVTTDQFKTSEKWGLQPVTLSARVFGLLKLYIEEVRPQVLAQNPHTAADQLWLTFDGMPDRKIGQRVTAFFTREISLHITTTAIRSLVETGVDQLHQKGLITTQQRDSVQAINGHTGQVTKDYYIMQQRGADVAHARAAFEHLLEEEDQSDEFPSPQRANSLPLALPLSPLPVRPPALSPPPLTWGERVAPSAIPFGTAHPDIHRASAKAHWTEEEINYIGDWCSRALERNPLTTNVVARCRDHIIGDTAAWPIFHPIHVLDSGRLRNGYRAWQQRK